MATTPAGTFITFEGGEGTRQVDADPPARRAARGRRPDGARAARARRDRRGRGRPRASCSTPTTPGWTSRPRSCSTRRAAPSSSPRSSGPRSRPARSCCATASTTPRPPTRATPAASTSRASPRSTRAATGGLVPDRTLVLDIDPALGIRRATAAERRPPRGRGPRLPRARARRLPRDRRAGARAACASSTHPASAEQVAERVAAALADLPALAPWLGGAR